MIVGPNNHNVCPAVKLKENVVADGLYCLSDLHMTYTSDRMSLIKTLFLTDCNLGFSWLLKHKADVPPYET